MATLLFLKNYNNYFNRIIKYEAYSDFSSSLDSNNSNTLTGINFDEADGLYTEQVVNWDKSFTPDYMMIIDAQNNILQRWFVIEWEKIRGKQYRAILKRDVIADIPKLVEAFAEHLFQCFVVQKADVVGRTAVFDS